MIVLHCDNVPLIGGIHFVDRFNAKGDWKGHRDRPLLPRTVAVLQPKQG